MFSHKFHPLKSAIRGWLKSPRNIKENFDYWYNCRQQQAVPEELHIELSSICNANCIFCAYQYDQRKRSVIDVKIFYKAVDEYWEMGGKKINLSPCVGEVFVDPKIIEKIKYIKQKGFQYISTYTNATLIQKFGAKKVLCSGITHILISTAPMIEEVYSKIYRTNHYKTVRQNIVDLLRSFNVLKKEASKELTVKKISLEFRADRSFEECLDTPDFKEFIQPHLSNNIQLKSINFYDAWSGAIKKEDLLQGMIIKDENFPKILPCEKTSMIQVTANGDLRLCGCRINTISGEDELKLGDFKDMGIQATYNTQKVKDIKAGFLKNKHLNVCKSCSWYEV